MKKTAVVTLLVILACVFSTTSFAQRSRAIKGSIVRDSIAQYKGIDAFSDGQGVFVRWVMKSELANVGFFVYRAGASGPELVSPGMIMSSYAGLTNRTLSDGTYEFYDVAGTLDSTYFITNQFANGNRLSTDAFRPKFTSDFLLDTGYTKAELEDHARSKNGILKRGDLSLPSGLQATVNSLIQPPNPEVQRTVVTQQSVKIAVKKEGMYRVTRAELEAAGFEVNSDSANWRLFTDGIEQAIIVGSGAQYIEFYGKELDTRDTDTRIYFLIADTVQGKRMITKFLGNIGGNVVSNNYRAVVSLKERKNYDFTLRNGDDLENYWGRVIYSDLPDCSVQGCLTLDLAGIDPSAATATLHVMLQGLSNNPHAVRAFINDNEIGLINGAGREAFSGELTVPTAILLERNNTLKFSTTLSSDSVLFDQLKITYPRKYVSEQNKLLFFTPGYRRMDVGGFASSNIRVFETTSDGNPQLISGLTVTQNGSDFAVRIPSNRPAVMVAVEDSALLQAPSIVADAPSTLSSPNNIADTIIISYSDPDFMSAAEAWANYRRSQAGGNFAVKVVDVTDVFDEFSFGAHSAEALNGFLHYAKTNWQSPAPRYVLLIGDASYDPRNYEGWGSWDFVPTKSLELIYTETPSDEALADFNHDGLADLVVGRIPARNAFAINTAFNKTTAFEVPAMQSLDRGAFFAYDCPQGFDFRAMSQILAAQLPPSMPKTFVGKCFDDTSTPNPQAQQNLLNDLNTGRYIVNYSGHGASGTWASTDFFSVNQVPLLTNPNRQSIFTMLTCLNGHFTLPRFDSIAEKLLFAQNGGGVATWASSTDTTPDYQLTLGTEFYREVGIGDIKRIGDLIADAKTTIPGSDVGYSWVLFGDPMLKVRE